MQEKVKGKAGANSSRDRILNEAVRLFARKGFGSTGLRELAAAAEVNLAMINYFFGSKKTLLKEILDHFFSGYLAVARIDLAGPEDLETRVERFTLGAAIYFEENRDALLIAITELPRDDPEILSYKANWGRQLMEIIDREICGPAREQDPDFPPARMVGPLLTSMLASRFLFSPVVSKMESGQEQMDSREYARYISGFLLARIRRKGSACQKDDEG